MKRLGGRWGAKGSYDGIERCGETTGRNVRSRGKKRKGKAKDVKEHSGEK